MFYWKLFCNMINLPLSISSLTVTILVLLEAVLQLKKIIEYIQKNKGHNPCFTGSCSAINWALTPTPFFNCHNPCFTGSCSAILGGVLLVLQISMSQSLFYWKLFCNPPSFSKRKKRDSVTILVLLEAVLQFIKGGVMLGA